MEVDVGEERAYHPSHNLANGPPWGRAQKGGEPPCRPRECCLLPPRPALPGRARFPDACSSPLPVILLGHARQSTVIDPLPPATFWLLHHVRHWPALRPLAWPDAPWHCGCVA